MVSLWAFIDYPLNESEFGSCSYLNSFAFISLILVLASFEILHLINSTKTSLKETK